MYSTLLLCCSSNMKGRHSLLLRLLLEKYCVTEDSAKWDPILQSLHMKNTISGSEASFFALIPKMGSYLNKFSIIFKTDCFLKGYLPLIQANILLCAVDYFLNQVCRIMPTAGWLYPGAPAVCWSCSNLIIPFLFFSERYLDFIGKYNVNLQEFIKTINFVVQNRMAMYFACSVVCFIVW